MNKIKKSIVLKIVFFDYQETKLTILIEKQNNESKKKLSFG